MFLVCLSAWQCGEAKAVSGHLTGRLWLWHSQTHQTETALLLFDTLSKFPLDIVRWWLILGLKFCSLNMFSLPSQYTLFLLATEQRRLQKGGGKLLIFVGNYWQIKIIKSNEDQIVVLFLRVWCSHIHSVKTSEAVIETWIWRWLSWWMLLDYDAVN